MLTIITDTSTLATSLTSLKAHLGITSSSEDTRLTALIYSAQKAIEGMVDGGLILTPTVFEDVLPSFPSHKIYIQQPPLHTLTSIKYYDGANVQQTLATDQYYTVKRTYGPAFVQPVVNWPSAYSRPDSIAIRYTAGFASVPPDLSHCVLMLAAHYNENREAELAGGATSEIKLGVDRVLRAYQWGSYV